MILPILKTLSLAFVALTAVAPSAAWGEKLTLHLSNKPIEVPLRDCFAQSEVDRGLEYHLQVVEERLAPNAMDPLSLRGAIISSPFRAFVPYRAHIELPEYSEAHETRPVRN